MRYLDKRAVLEVGTINKVAASAERGKCRRLVAKIIIGLLAMLIIMM
jgi:hypothetical protein